MKADQTLRLDIDGHTDNVGSDENNQILSEKRANSVKEYLVKRGVSEDRLKATGYGEEKPVEDNATAAGRAKTVSYTHLDVYKRQLLPTRKNGMIKNCFKIGMLPVKR